MPQHRYQEAAKTPTGLQAREPGRDPAPDRGKDTVRELFLFKLVTFPALISRLCLSVPSVWEGAREGAGEYWLGQREFADLLSSIYELTLTLSFPLPWGSSLRLWL